MFTRLHSKPHVVDGHNVEELVKVLNTAKTSKNGKPKAAMCKSFGGKGFSGIENELNWPFGAAGARIIEQLDTQISTKSTSLRTMSPANQESAKPNLETKLTEAPSYAIDSEVASGHAPSVRKLLLGMCISLDMCPTAFLN